MPKQTWQDRVAQRIDTRELDQVRREMKAANRSEAELWTLLHTHHRIAFMEVDAGHKLGALRALRVCDVMARELWMRGHQMTLPGLDVTRAPKGAYSE